jgi:hypothetical protein
VASVPFTLIAIGSSAAVPLPSNSATPFTLMKSSGRMSAVALGVRRETAAPVPIGKSCEL